jgi:hypothetical protein
MPALMITQVRNNHLSSAESRGSLHGVDTHLEEDGEARERRSAGLADGASDAAGKEVGHRPELRFFSAFSVGAVCFLRFLGLIFVSFPFSPHHRDHKSEPSTDTYWEVSGDRYRCPYLHGSQIKRFTFFKATWAWISN